MQHEWPDHVCPTPLPRDAQLLLVDGLVGIAVAPVGVPIYDFAFERYLPTGRGLPQTATPCVSRIGAISSEYVEIYRAFDVYGVRLIHSQEHHFRCSRLPNWYPLLEDLTPKSIWFDGEPDAKAIASELGWPVFVRGAVKSLGHQRDLSIVSDADALRHVIEEFAKNPRLAWQQMVFRSFVPLRLVEDEHRERLPASFEFRTFWWHGELVGLGRYWWDARPNTCMPSERAAALGMAQEAAARVKVPFLVVDVAQTAKGRWVVIECNDGQESGYAGVSPIALWQRIIDGESRVCPAETE